MFRSFLVHHQKITLIGVVQNNKQRSELLHVEEVVGFFRED